MTLRAKIAILLSINLLLSWQAVANESLFTPLTEAKVYKQTERHFSPFELISAIEKSTINTTTVQGKLTRINYKIPVSFEPSHIINNYKQQISVLNGQILFECHQKSCGNVSKLMKQLKPLNNIYKSSPALLTAKVQLEKKLVYLSAFSTNWEKEAVLQLDIIEVIEEPLDLIAVNPEFLGAEVVQKTFKDMSHKDTKNASDHPMIARLPGAYIEKYQQFDFGQTAVFTAVNNGQHAVKQLEGKITDINYKLPRTYSEFEVNANYQSALLKLGFVKTFNCQGKACGKPRHIEKRTKTLAHIGDANQQFYSLYTLTRAEGNVHAMTYIIGFEGGLWGEIKLVEETSLVDDRVSIDLDGLTDKIAQTGHVALDGLLFKFDSDEMLPDAEPVVEVVATYLKSHPKQSFYVIGHTDDKGKQSYNQVLSDKRAKAVVKQLTSAHKVPKSQLTAKGIGEYSPVANNSNEAGQKLNRRVELVLRSDNK
ncbi:OmpA family protein [Shewanella eurypsychrophilus]|uniref:OmpA family protein n=1 Tax=Shewanella eurypsychrophilus TaxID=2593656 RepID=A0ABX6VCC6_9GAMM|nr:MULTISPECIES: OmpA family protein [Shewanella]QFU24356.1 OmpA family protein [Shewanella sp. YLB-09]QPG59556.1 OmpA family protein [Shewanella eurypsychrophilus]